jgi:RNA polymerase sigma-70 factor (ECF subfamily)
MPSSEQTPPPDAFIRALSECQSALRGYCQAALGHGEAAKEAWQRTNVVLWRKAGDWNMETPFLRWALTVARFEVLATVRDLARERLVFDSDVVEALAETAAVEAVHHDERSEALAHCLEKLRPDHRVLLSKHYVLGHAQAEIAAAHGLTVGALKVTLLRLRRGLADCIERQMAREA